MGSQTGGNRMRCHMCVHLHASQGGKGKKKRRKGECTCCFLHNILARLCARVGHVHEMGPSSTWCVVVIARTGCGRVVVNSLILSRAHKRQMYDCVHMK